MWSNRTKIGARAAAMALVLVPIAGGAAAQGGELPFAPGETCVYRGSGPLGRMGTGSFAVEPVDADGRSAYLLRFDFRGRLGIAPVENHTRSWFLPSETASIRFTKMERSPLSTKRQEVVMDAGTGRWSSPPREGTMPTTAPLDELSFVFFLRTLRLADGDSYTLTRHYDPARNPVVVRVVGRGPVQVPAGTFQAIEVEMRVRDPNHYGREGIIRYHFTDDARRIPVRIESRIPVAGRVVLALDALTPTCGGSPVRARAVD